MIDTDDLAPNGADLETDQVVVPVLALGQFPEGVDEDVLVADPVSGIAAGHSFEGDLPAFVDATNRTHGHGLFADPDGRPYCEVDEIFLVHV